MNKTFDAMMKDEASFAFMLNMVDAKHLSPKAKSNLLKITKELVRKKTIANFSNYDPEKVAKQVRERRRADYLDQVKTQAEAWAKNRGSGRFPSRSCDDDQKSVVDSTIVWLKRKRRSAH